jgi:peptide/nickel transport system substrate-binding protein
MPEWTSLSTAITRRRFVVGAGAAAAAAVVGCGGSKDSSDGGGDNGGGGGGSGGKRTDEPLRVAVSGGGEAETLNPLLSGNDTASWLRGLSLFEWVAVLGPDLEPKLHLAESIEANSTGSEWTIRLRQGIKWHDGKPVTADDLKYTFVYAANPKTGAPASSITALMDVKRIKKLDERTVRIPMKEPVGDLPSLISSTTWALIQDGTTSFDKPIGTGPFRFESWARGQRSTFVRNEDYWQSGEPHAKSLEIVSIDDEAARLNALLADQVDVVGAVNFAQAKNYLAQGDSAPIKLLVGESPQATSFTMGTAHAPFDDPRVRQAMRLLVDRKQMIDSAQFGFGEVANDLPCLGQPLYNGDLPRRERDVEQARALLKQAGRENLSLVLDSTDGSFFPGQLEAATLLAEQAKEAGVKITVRKHPLANYYTSVFPNYPFAQIQWTASTIPLQYLYAYLPESGLNGSQWKDPTTTKLLRQALRTVHKGAAAELWNQVQEELWNRGPEIYWGTCPTIDAVSKRVQGATASRAGLLNNLDLRRWSVA